jgi:CheY-like chemotaxis protein
MFASENKGPSRAFVQELRWTLRRLLVPEELRRSALAELLPLNQKDVAAALERLLLEAIAALKPSSSVPHQSTAWRTYHILTTRYVQHFRQSEVARSLNLSPRQMRRQESLALRILAGYLWTRYDLENKARDWRAPARTATQAHGGMDLADPGLQGEIEWLVRGEGVASIAASDWISSTLKVARLLADKFGVEVTAVVPRALSPVAAQPTALRQALLNLLTAIMRLAPQGRIHLVAEEADAHVYLTVTVEASPTASAPVAAVPAEALQVIATLLRVGDGWIERLHPSDEGSLLVYRLAVPTMRLLPVLIVDDNAETLRLFQRYLVGSRYRYFGTQDPEAALSLALQVAPRLIVLDVMLPGIDGWELLSRLREHPKLRGTPIGVCTILPQEELALALGAAKFIKKPVARADFLRLLDELADWTAPTVR